MRSPGPWWVRWPVPALQRRCVRRDSTSVTGVDGLLRSCQAAGFSVSGKISRKEFGLKWNALTDAGSVVAGDEVKFLGEIQFIKQQG